MRKIIAPVLALAASLSFALGAQADQLNINAQTGTTYTFLNTDCSKLVTFSNAAAISVTLPQASSPSGGGSGSGLFMPPCAIYAYNASTASAGTVTITPTTSTIDGATQLVLQPGEGAAVVSDGVNYQVSKPNAATTGRLNGNGLRQMGLIFTLAASTSTGANGTETTLSTFSLPANSLDVVGRRLHIHATFLANTTGNNKTYKVYFGSETISSGALGSNGTTANADLWVVKTAANTQIVSGAMTVGTAVITGVSLAGAETDTSAITIKATGQNGSSVLGDISLTDFEIEFLN